MHHTNAYQFDRISRAIRHIRQHFKRQPSLDEIAAAVNMSPHHFQKVFTRLAGISPKQFLQYTKLEFTRPLLAKYRASLSETSWETGLSSTGRLHHLYISMEAMTPGEYKNGGKGLNIAVGFYNTFLGKVMVASTSKGICQLVFNENDESAFKQLKKQYFAASVNMKQDARHLAAIRMFQENNQPENLHLHLKGTPYQIKVWEALLSIPEGRLTTYSDIATAIGKSTACRAVGNAVGSNPVAVLIPCHRVIRSDGGVGGYRWGIERKTALIGKELYNRSHL